MLRGIVRRDPGAFVVVWGGQVASIVGSALTGFALGVWLFQRSGAVTDLAANALCATLPMAVLSPLAGALVDRHDRRILMILSDCAAASVTLAIAALALGGRLAPWHVYASMATISAANAVQGPAYQATVALLVLSFATPIALGGVMSAAGVGGLAGSVLMSAWGGPRRRIHGLLGFSALAGLCMVLAALRPSVALLGVAYAGRYVCGPMFSGCATAIQQSKVAPEMQGRAFALGSAVQGATLTLVYLAAGPLADGVFEPLMATGGPLAGSAGTLIGAGPGRGIARLMGLLGLLTMGVAAVGRLSPRLYRIEDELPDVVLPGPARDLRVAGASTGVAEV